MAYIPAYKLSPKLGASKSDNGQSEGIQAFLARIQTARREADTKEDLQIQEKVLRGEINIDEQIEYNKKRQLRYAKDTKEWQQLQNNIADLEVSRKWDAFNTMDANARPRKDQRSYLQDWLGSVKQDSDLYTQIADKIGTLTVQIARDDYNNAYQKKQADLEQGRTKRTDVISFLKQQLQMTTDEALKADVQAQIDTQETALLQDADNFRNATISQYDRTGHIGDEGRLLGLLENDQQKDLSDGDAASAASRAGEIDSQKRYLVGLTIQKQIDKAYGNWLGKQDITQNEKYLSTLKDIGKKGDITVGYETASGGTKTFKVNGLQNYQMSFGDMNGQTLGAGIKDKMNQFITKTYIPDYAQSIKDNFTKMQDRFGSNYNGLEGEAKKFVSQWSSFMEKDEVKPFASLLQSQSLGQGGVLKTMLSGMMTALGNEFSSGSASDSQTLSKLEKMQNLFPQITGSDFEQSAIAVKQQIGTANFEKFQSSILEKIGAGGDFQGQIREAQNRLDLLSASGKLDPDMYLKLKDQLSKTGLDVTKNLAKFNKQYGSSFDIGKAYKDFLPTNGKFNAPGFDTGKLPDIIPQLFKTDIASLKTLGYKIPDPSKLAGYKEEDLIRGTAFDPNGIYLKPGVQKNW